jgi:hypothetical protein
MKKILLVITCLGTITLAHAQSTNNVSGLSKNVNGVQHDVSIGEMAVISTNTTGNTTVTHGVLQPSITIEAPAVLELDINVYPNPTSSIINIELGSAADVNWQLLDMSGKVIMRGSGRNTTKLQADVQQLATGQYSLVTQSALADGATKSATFKIQKQ